MNKIFTFLAGSMLLMGSAAQATQVAIYSPEYQGETVPEIVSFQVSVSPASTTVSEGATGLMTFYNDSFTSYVSVASFDFVEEKDDMAIYTVTPRRTITGTGKWSFEIEAGAIAGVQSFVKTWTLGAAPEPDPEPEPTPAEVELVSITPADGASVAGFSADAENSVVVEFANLTSPGELEFEVYNSDNEYEFSGYTFAPAEGSTYVWNAATDYVLYEGLTYKASFTLYDADHKVVKEFSVNWSGATPAPAVTESAVKILSINPDPETCGRLKGTANVFTFTFDAPVTFLKDYSMVSAGGQGADTAELTAISGDDNKEWVLNVPVAMMSNPEINLILFFQDGDGLFVSTESETANLYPYYASVDGVRQKGFAVRYDVTAGVQVPFTPQPNGLIPVNIIDQIWASYGAYSIRWSNLVAYSDIKIYDEAGEVVSEAYNAFDQYPVESGKTSNMCTIQFAPSIVKAGTYDIIIPFGTFALGEEFDTLTYAGQTLTYIVSGKLDSIDTITVDDAASAMYFNLQGVRVAQPLAGKTYIRVAGDKASKVVF